MPALPEVYLPTHPVARTQVPKLLPGSATQSAYDPNPPSGTSDRAQS